MILDFGNGPQIAEQGNGTRVSNGTVTTGNLDDKSNLVTVIWAVNLTAFVLVGIFVPLRTIVRCTVTRNFFSDDVLVIIAALFTFGICSLLPIATDLGLGQHSWNLDPEVVLDDTQALMELIFIANTIYPCAIAFARLSAIGSFLRIITDKTSRYMMYAVAALTGVFGFASVFAVIFQCKPISAAWNSTVSGASCYPFSDFLRASTAINIALNALLCTVPLPYIWRMRYTSLAKKIALTVLFVFAGLACAAVVLKLIYVQPLNQDDATYNWVAWYMCSISECTIAIVCISIPPIVPLFTRCFRKKLRIPVHRRGNSPRFTMFPGKPTCNRSVTPRIIRPMATPWKDEPRETTMVPDFHWLKLEQVEYGRCWDRYPQSSKADQILGIAL